MRGRGETPQAIPGAKRDMSEAESKHGSGGGGAPGAGADAAKLYEELRVIASRMFSSERAGHTLQPTAVVNEACLRIMAGGLPDVPREQKLALAGRVLKQVLIDHSRGRDAEKRGGGAAKLELDRDVIADGETIVEFDAIHRALEKLRALSERQAEVVTLRIFSGMTMEQVASVLGLSKRSAEADWTVARAWLRRELDGKGA
jgi:RNA polymerase sigma-70 factor, ECF subfamily